jgi:hypothetical protein
MCFKIAGHLLPRRRLYRKRLTTASRRIGLKSGQLQCDHRLGRARRFCVHGDTEVVRTHRWVDVENIMKASLCTSKWISKNTTTIRTILLRSTSTMAKEPPVLIEIRACSGILESSWIKCRPGTWNLGSKSLQISSFNGCRSATPGIRLVSRVEYLPPI